MKRLSTIAFGLLTLTAVACRSGGDDDGSSGGDGGTRRDSSIAGSVTIQEIQTPPGLALGTQVDLEGVVVTAIDSYGSRTGSFWVQDPAGGPYSGVMIFTTDTSAVADLQPGDVVNLRGGEVDEFALTGDGGDDSGRTLTEVGDPEGGSIEIEETGTMPLPAAEVVDPAVLGADDAESEKWEGVLIQFNSVSVVSAPRGVSDSDPTLTEMRVTGPYRVGSSLVALPETLVLDTCLGSLTGVLDYFFDYRLLPRSGDDIVTGDTCAPPENTAEMCSNEDDDDSDGFTDCLDCSCILAEGTGCVGAATIPEVQDPAQQQLGARVTITGAIVTGISSRDVWVQAPTGNTYAGLDVFVGDAGPPAGLAIGDIVTVTGSVDEFFDVTELTSGCGQPATITETGTGVAPAPQVVTDAAMLTVAATAEPLEGMLVTLANVAVLSAKDDHGEFTVGTAAAPLTVDDVIFDAPEPLPARYTTLTGVLHYSFGSYRVLPRSAADLVAAP